MEIKNNYALLFYIKNKTQFILNNLKYIFLFLKLNFFLFSSNLLKI